VSWPWRSPQATRQALTDRIKARYPQEQRPQRLREIAYRRLLARIFAEQPDRWVVKGGAALLLRLDPNRTSNDIDLAYVAEAGEHAVALTALEEALARDLGDFFEFDLARDRMTEINAEHPLERALAVPVVARVGGRTFAEFAIDLVLPRDDVLEVEWLESDRRSRRRRDPAGCRDRVAVTNRGQGLRVVRTSWRGPSTLIASAGPRRHRDDRGAERHRWKPLGSANPARGAPPPPGGHADRAVARRNATRRRATGRLEVALDQGDAGSTDRLRRSQESSRGIPRPRAAEHRRRQTLVSLAASLEVNTRQAGVRDRVGAPWVPSNERSAKKPPQCREKRAPPVGFEPTTCGLEVRCSIQLSYRGSAGQLRCCGS
jgi:hypothetical protein